MAPSEGKISLAPLLAVNFVGTLGFSIVVPFLVVLVTRWGGNAVVYGILAAAYSFSSCSARQYWGACRTGSGGARCCCSASWAR